MPSGLGCASGALVAPKSGTSYPTHLPRGTALPVLGSGGFTNVGSHQIQRLRSLQGLPFRSAEARLYMTRRLAGHPQPHFKCAPRTPGGRGSRRDVGVLPAKECNASMRCVYGRLRSYSAIWLEGKKKISVLMPAIFTSPLFTSGAKSQCVAVSVGRLPFPTTQSSRRSACRVAPPLSE